jgi:hypothetical protein
MKGVDVHSCKTASTLLKPYPKQKQVLRCVSMGWPGLSCFVHVRSGDGLPMHGMIFCLVP